MIEAFDKFRVYILGIHFTQVTDCLAIKKSLEKKKTSICVRGSSIRLQDLDYTIEHRPGKKMGHVDALSRATEVALIDEAHEETDK